MKQKCSGELDDAPSQGLTMCGKTQVKLLNDNEKEMDAMEEDKSFSDEWSESESDSSFWSSGKSTEDEDEFDSELEGIISSLEHQGVKVDKSQDDEDVKDKAAHKKRVKKCFRSFIPAPPQKRSDVMSDNAIYDARMQSKLRGAFAAPPPQKKSVLMLDDEIYDAPMQSEPEGEFDGFAASPPLRKSDVMLDDAVYDAPMQTAPPQEISDVMLDAIYDAPRQAATQQEISDVMLDTIYDATRQAEPRNEEEISLLDVIRAKRAKQANRGDVLSSCSAVPNDSSSTKDERPVLSKVETKSDSMYDAPEPMKKVQMKFMPAPSVPVEAKPVICRSAAAPIRASSSIDAVPKVDTREMELRKARIKLQSLRCYRYRYEASPAEAAPELDTEKTPQLDTEEMALKTPPKPNKIMTKYYSERLSILSEIANRLPDVYERRPWLDEKDVTLKGIEMNEHDIIFMLNSIETNGVLYVFEALGNKQLLRFKKSLMDTGMSSLPKFYNGLQKACGEEQYFEYILTITIYVLLLYAIIMKPDQPLPDLWEEINEPSASTFILSKIRDVQLYLRKRDDLHPFLYHRMELGWNLQEVAVNVLRRSLAKDFSQCIDNK